MAVYWPTPGFKERTFQLCVLNRWDFNFCVQSSPLRVIGKRRKWWRKSTTHWEKAKLVTETWTTGRSGDGRKLLKGKRQNWWRKLVLWAELVTEEYYSKGKGRTGDGNLYYGQNWWRRNTTQWVKAELVTEGVFFYLNSTVYIHFHVSNSIYKACKPEKSSF